MLTYARSTYAEIRNNVYADIRENAKLAALTPEQFIGWVLKAEERICQLCDISEEYRLFYSEGVTDYFLQDHPPITGVSTSGAPITITSTAHGLAVNDNIYVRDVQGAVNANGRMRVTAVPDANSFSIKRFGRVTGVSDDLVNPTITIRDHPFVTGDSVTFTEVEGATEINGTWTITKVDKDSFTITNTFSSRNAYTGEGIAVADATNTATYVGGGRYWKENEVPAHVGVLKDSTVLYNAYTVPVTARTFEDLERERAGRVEYIFAYPFSMALGYKDGKEFLRIDPETSADGNLDLLFKMQVLPRNHYDDTIDTSILLQSKHDSAIEEYVKSKITGSVLKDPEMAQVFMNNFERHTQSFNIRQPEPRMKVVYT